MAVDSMYYVHEADKAALKALQAIPGFSALMKAFMKVWNERLFRISNMSTHIRLSETQLPKYYNMLPPICEKLGIEVPELYLEMDVRPNSYTSGETKPFIVITSGLLNSVPEELIPTVLAHECGHIACHHVLYRTMGSMLLDSTRSALSYFLPHAGLLTLPLVVGFYYWMRCSELSADRAAVIVDGDAKKMSDVCLCFAGYDKEIAGAANKEEFMKQAEEYREMIKGSAWDKTLEFFSLFNESHPFTAVRALECVEFEKSEQFQHILDGTYMNQPTGGSGSGFGGFGGFGGGSDNGGADGDGAGSDDTLKAPWVKDDDDDAAKASSGNANSAPLKAPWADYADDGTPAGSSSGSGSGFGSGSGSNSGSGFGGFGSGSSDDKKQWFKFDGSMPDFSKFTQAFKKSGETAEPSDSALAGDLRNLKALLDEGLISKDEYEAKKKQLLGL
ncbi:MAG: M48 family metalloprotease [Lachnospiraceae bacterium]|nr:M48 family metalloprotease [Lachnospiraceae bacterium]